MSTLGGIRTLKMTLTLNQPTLPFAHEGIFVALVGVEPTRPLGHWCLRPACSTNFSTEPYIFATYTRPYLSPSYHTPIIASVTV